VQRLLIEIIKAADPKLDGVETALLISTFNAGLCLQQNLGEISKGEQKIDTRLCLFRRSL